MTAPEVLYHYTDVNGLIGILINHAIWSTHIYALNDSKEESQSHSVISNFLLNESVKAKNSYEKWMQEVKPSPRDQGCGSEADGRSNESGFLKYCSDNIEAALLAPHLEFRKPNIFTFSFSSKDDSLSQWRGYCPDGGYNIGFSVDYLNDFCGSVGGQLNKCEYEECNQYDLIQKALNPLLEKMRENKYYEYTILENADQLLHKVIHYTNEVRPLIKHASFEEECEWRIIIKLPGHRDDPKVKFRSRGQYVVPFLESKFKEVGPTDTLYLNQICVGPTLDFNRAKMHVEYLCQKSRVQITSRPEIVKSTSSFRV